jgi:hypothetical protein
MHIVRDAPLPNDPVEPTIDLKAESMERQILNYQPADRNPTGAEWMAPAIRFLAGIWGVSACGVITLMAFGVIHDAPARWGLWWPAVVGGWSAVVVCCWSAIALIFVPRPNSRGWSIARVCVATVPMLHFGYLAGQSVWLDGDNLIFAVTIWIGLSGPLLLSLLLAWFERRRPR